MRVLSRLIATAALATVAYLGVTAAIGAYVGLRIHAATHRNTVAAIGSHLLGTRRVDAYALRQANLPAVIVRSPAFWAGLHSTQ
ncbi:hypothetical protein EPN52_03985 [bacterium]|nr:MAG: hypothetical protein EPN52_03985 [bacterium]